MRAAAIVVLCACQAPAPQDKPATAVPTSVVSASVVVDGDHACAITAHHEVTCWGATPTQLPGLDDVAGLAADNSGTCAWTAHGAVKCWAGDSKPELVPTIGDAVQVTVAGSACALRANGHVACWSSDRNAREVPGLAGAVEIAGTYGGGAQLLCARLKSGEVTCGNSVTPFAVIPPLAGATSIAGAGCRYAALLPDHRIATWVGWTGRPMPVFLDKIDGKRVIVGGHLDDEGEVCVVGTQARCWSWGQEPALRLTETPPLPAGVRDLGFDTEATCARIGDRIECAGRVGRLGDGEPEYAHDFVSVQGITDARQLDAVGRTTCALRANGHVVCWGERLHGEDEAATTIDRVPFELPGVTDAVEIAMEGADRGNGTIGIAAAVCARRVHGATCWTSKHGQLVAANAPELATATKLISGGAICGVSSNSAVTCVRLHEDQGYIPTFSEDDYERIVYQGSSDTAPRRIARELEKRVRSALVAHQPLEGFHTAGTSDPIGPTDRTFQPPSHDAVELRRIAWSVGRDSDRVRGAICARHGDGTVACWGERDYLGANQHSERAAWAPIR
jgi:hypothetical protein